MLRAASRWHQMNCHWWWERNRLLWSPSNHRVAGNIVKGTQTSKSEILCIDSEWYWQFCGFFGLRLHVYLPVGVWGIWCVFCLLKHECCVHITEVNANNTLLSQFMHLQWCGTKSLHGTAQKNACELFLGKLIMVPVSFQTYKHHNSSAF